MSTAPLSDLVQTDWTDIPSPALVVDVARLDTNITTVAKRFADRGVRLRPHIKTSKCLEVAERQRAAGAVGFTCSTPEEVSALGSAGFSGLLWAHQPVGASKVTAAVNFADRWGVTMIIDSLDVARPIAAEADARGVVVDYLLDVDTGHARTGVAPSEAVGYAQEIASLSGLALRGVLTHEGHLAALGNRELIDTAGAQAASTLTSVAAQLTGAGFDCSTVSVGSTPGMASAPWILGVTEARPGTYIFFDANQVRLGSATIGQCALTVLSRVVSVRGDQAILDAGSRP